jgi:hypothetical protein
MTSEIVQSSRDWLSSPRTSALAWWIPKAAIVVALFSPPSARTGVWIIALVWMATACILNAKRCGRTHCRYTGPYYLTMIVSVVVLASGVISVDFYAWLSLAVLILGGSMIIWWATEKTWGKFARHGRTVLEGKGADLEKNEQVQEIYLGIATQAGAGDAPPPS